MACLPDALKRHDFIKQSLMYDNLVIEEGAQMRDRNLHSDVASEERGRTLEVETRRHDRRPQPTPASVVKHAAFQKYSNMDQSMFARDHYVWARRTRSSTRKGARGPSWRICTIGDTKSWGIYPIARNALRERQRRILASVAIRRRAREESAPTPFFYQNIEEAEYVVSVYQYMRLCGYPAEKISILTTYNPDKSACSRCGESAMRESSVIRRPRRT